MTHRCFFSTTGHAGNARSVARTSRFLAGGALLASTLAPLSAAHAQSPSPANVRIYNARVDEGDRGANVLYFGVSLSQPATTEVKLAYWSTPVTATQGVSTLPISQAEPTTDYREAGGILLIPKGQTKAVIRVLVVGDTTPEDNETFNLSVRLLRGNARIARKTAFGTIRNDDGTPLHQPQGRIALMTDSENESRPDVGVINADGTHFTVPRTDVAKADGDISPDGTKLLFTDLVYGGRSDLFARDLATGKETQLTTDQNQGRSGRWSPDGKYIAFTNYSSGSNNLLIMNKAVSGAKS